MEFGWARRGVFTAALVVVVMLASGASASAALHWKSVRIQAPARISQVNANNALFGNLVCLTASDCWSAGTGLTTASTNVPFMEHWNGTAFRLVATSVGNAFLQGVGCATANECWVAGAAGTNATAYGQLGHYVPLLEQWNGKTWTAVPTPNPAGNVDDELADVSCVSEADCYAVGWVSTASRADQLIEHWNGHAWSIETDAPIGGAQFARLDGIDCVRASDCIIVGQYEPNASEPPNAFSEQGSGSHWSLHTMPAPATPNDWTEMEGLSCPSASDCLATGTAFFWPGGGLDPGAAIAERWNGTKWSLVAPHLKGPKSGGEVNRLNDISCVSATHCWAVGSTFTDMEIAPGVTASWNGMRFATGVNANPLEEDSLDAVGCITATDCLATGFGESGTKGPVPIALQLVSTGASHSAKH